MTHLIKWLSQRDSRADGLLSIRQLEKNAGCPDSTIRHALKSENPRKIPEKWVKPIEKELKKYGYKQTNC